MDVCTCMLLTFDELLAQSFIKFCMMYIESIHVYFPLCGCINLIWLIRGLSMSCSKNCRCSDLCTNRPFRKDKKIKIVKVLDFLGTFVTNLFTPHFCSAYNSVAMLHTVSKNFKFVSLFFLKSLCIKVIGGWHLIFETLIYLGVALKIIWSVVLLLP